MVDGVNTYEGSIICTAGQLTRDHRRPRTSKKDHARSRPALDEAAPAGYKAGPAPVDGPLRLVSWVPALLAECLRMTRRFPHYAVLAYVVVGGFTIVAALPGQEAPPHPSEPPAVALPPAPQGVEVLARGPVHEAFATPTTEPVATKPVAKAPPAPLEELPPSDKPEGNASWIGGYWAWDDERNDFLWVSGTWRTPPPGQSWVAGYWRADGQQWHWVPGFWTAVQKEMVAQPVTYLPEPPAVPHVASPGIAPTPESFYVPGHWVWHEAGYTAVGGERVWRGAGYVWVAGYWAQVQPGYVWVSAHYRWTPGGYIFIPGYWDLVLANRGMLYAPVVVDTAVVGPR